MLLVDIQVLVKRKVGSTWDLPIVQLRLANMHFYQKNFMFSLNFQLTISFLFIIKKCEWKQICFCRYTTHWWKEKKKNSCSRYYSWRANTVKAKITFYTNLKSTVGPCTELSDSLKKAQLEKSLRKKISDMQLQAKLREKSENFTIVTKRIHKCSMRWRSLK